MVAACQPDVSFLTDSSESEGQAWDARHAAFLADQIERKQARIGHEDYFQILGVPHDAAPARCRDAYLLLTRWFNPSRPTALGLLYLRRPAARIVMRLAEAHAVLTDPKLRTGYVEALASGDPRSRGAAEAYARGELSLKRDRPAAAERCFARAVELQPGRADYAATLLRTRRMNAGGRPADPPPRSQRARRGGRRARAGQP